MTETDTAYYHSPLGVLEISGTSKGITWVAFVERAPATRSAIPDSLRDCMTQLDEYFSGKRREFALTLDLQGTEFQKKVWRALLQIPFGKTLSYRDVATRVGDRNALRAVGAANGQNPISIIVPCHRVIGSDGSLTGYGGGLWRKEWLLNLEGSRPQTGLFDARHG